jgi:hypothetical protein
MFVLEFVKRKGKRRARAGQKRKYLVWEKVGKSNDITVNAV